MGRSGRREEEPIRGKQVEGKRSEMKREAFIKNNARLGNKRERGLLRSKRWAIRRGVCLKRSRMHCGLVLRRMFVLRCLKSSF